MKRLSLLSALILSGLAGTADAHEDSYVHESGAPCASCGDHGSGWAQQCCVRPARHMTDWWAGYCEDQVPCANCGFANGGLLCPLACKLKAWKAGFHHGCGECCHETACCEEPVCEETCCEPDCCQDACGGCHLWDWFRGLRSRFHGGCCQETACCEEPVYEEACCEPDCCQPSCGGRLRNWFHNLRARFHGGGCDTCCDAGYGEPTESGMPTEVTVPEASPNDLPPAPPMDESST